jgi:hypothetical protein
VGPLDQNGALTPPADSTAEPVNRVLPLTFTVKQLHLADPNDSVKQKLIELFVPALNAQSKIFRYMGISELAKHF